MEHFNPNPGDIDSHDIEQFDEDDNWRSDADVNKDFWDIKRDENAESGLTEDVRAIGVRVPVTVQHSKLVGPVIRGGHHRIAAAMEVNPDMLIPVNYAEDNETTGEAITGSHELERKSSIADPVLQKHVKNKYGGFYMSEFKSPTSW